MSTVRRYGQLIDGEWVESSSDEFIERKSPATGQLLAEFTAGTKEDADRAIQAARRAFDHGPWPRMSGLERAAILRALAEKINENREKLARIDAEEVGKPIRIARGDIDGAANLTYYAASLAMQVHGEAYTNLGPKYTGLVVREPVGVVGQIVPWNFPGLILCQKMPFALAAGCTVVIKPSEFTSGSALEICKLAEEAGVPKGVINIVTGYGNTVGQAIVDSPYVDRISFTGSGRTGKRVIDGSKVNFKRISLELGGKSANVVFADADLEDALDGTMYGVYLNQGECCCAGSRLIIEDKVADEFLEDLVRRSQQLKVGLPLDESTDISALIHQGHMDKVLQYVELGKKQGASLLTGGERLSGGQYDGGFFVEPTIFDNVEAGMQIFDEEIFGPVLTVTRFSTPEEAPAIANNTSYGLANAVWSKDIDKAITTARGLQSGTVWVNTMVDGAPQLPFGGYKASGFGREMGNIGLEEFTEQKSINIHLGKRTPFFS